MNQPENDKPLSPRGILLAVGIAFTVGSAVLAVAILPAEFGVDPLGTGQILGLNALGAETNPLEEQTIPHRTDSVEFELGPFQSVEYKYTMDIDTPMIFSWQSSGELYYDMHAEPAGLGEDYAESFEQGSGMSRTGSFHAPFTGIHGWFWENRGTRTVSLRLHASGYFVDSTVFRDGGDFSRAIDPVTD